MQYIKECIEYGHKKFVLHKFKPKKENLIGMIQIIHGMAEDI